MGNACGSDNCCSTLFEEKKINEVKIDKEENRTLWNQGLSNSMTRSLNINNNHSFESSKNRR